MTLARLSKKTDFKLYDHIFFGTVPRVVTYATTKRRPTNRTYARLVFLSIALLLGCNRKFQPGSTAPEIPPAKSPEYSFRGYFIDGRMPFSDVFSKLRQKNFRAVIFSIDETMDPSDRKANIDNAITEAHQNELLLIASVEVLKIQGNAAVMMNPARPDHKRALKEKIADLVRAFNFDGLHILIRPDQVSGFINDPESQQIFQSDSLQVPMNFAEWARYRITDLVEDAVAEAMLVKPYLPVCISLGDLETGKSDEYDNMVLGWLEKGIADFIIPFFHFEDAATETVNWQNLKNRTPLHRYIYPLLEFSGESAGAPLQARIENLAREEAEGFVIYLPEGGGLDPVIVPSFPADPAWDNYAANYKRADPRQYVGLNLRHFLEPGLEDRLIVTGNGTSVKKPDSLGRIGLVCPQVPDTISLQINQQFIHLPVADWALPFKYEVLPDMKTRRELPWLEFRRTPGRIGSDSIFHFLFKTAYPARTWINGDTAKVYKTGIFFSSVILEEGANRIWASAMTPDGQKSFYEQEFIYRGQKSDPDFSILRIDSSSVEPTSNIMMTRDNKITVRFSGTKGGIGKIETIPAGPVIQCSGRDAGDFSIYESRLSLAQLTEDIPYKLKLSIRSGKTGMDEDFVELIPETTVTVRAPESFPCVRTKDDNSIVNYNLGSVRLGGPFLGEYPSGIIFKTDAKIGGSYRVRLDEMDAGYIDVRNVIVLPVSKAPTPYYITSISCGPSDSADIVSIPYLQPVPYAVFPEPDLNRIRIRIYGAMTSSTWISHRTGRKYVDKITWQQVRPETYDVMVNLYTSKIWGYDVTVEGRSLVLRLRYPPRFELRPEKPLDGIRIVIEAGHGGEGIGAEGLSGLPEKEVNLGLALTLGSLLKSVGAEVLQVRATDTTMSLYDKRDIARFSGSDILISIHANAASTRNGYLGVGGTSTYYHNPFWAGLAEKVYDRLLELGLDEFGVVGSFNYTVTRVTQMPAILVEQAFMTHAEDEEKLADESFRRDMAGKIYLGILDYLKYMAQ